jgi:hypothetical protein
MVERLGGWQQEELHIVGDDVSLEAGLDIFCKLSGTFDHKRIVRPPDLEGGAKFSLRIEKAGWAGFSSR